MRKGKKPPGMKHRIREERKKEERIAVIITVTILIILIFISGFLINSMLNQPSANQPVSSTLEPKAAIVDHLSLTYPNQTFIQTATTILKQAGYSVDYHPGEEVTVEFYQNLPAHKYGIIILRVHSAGHPSAQTPEPVELALFTCEPYSTDRYVYEQLMEQVGRVAYSSDSQEKFFGIGPKFVQQCMIGKFKNSVIIMMGCDGLVRTQMAEAFVEKGARTYVGWNGSITAGYTDQATTRLLQHYLIEEQTLRESIRETIREIGADPVYNSPLIYYPLVAGSYTIQNVVDNLVTSTMNIQLMQFYETKYTKYARARTIHPSLC